MSGNQRHSVAEVARILGISERGVRDRIERGTLDAVKQEGQRGYRILLPPDAVVHAVGTTATGGSLRGSGAVGDAVGDMVVTPAVVEQAIQRTGQQYTSDLRTMLVELREVYEGQLAAKDQVLAAKDETIAELRRRAEAAEAEQERLRGIRRQAVGAHAAQVEEIADRTTRADEAEAWRDNMETSVRRSPHGEASPEAPMPAAPAEGLWARVRRWWTQDT